MSLVKWMRKNRTQIMAVVVIVLMVGFIGGSALEYLLQGSGGGDEAVAHYGKKTKITPRTLNDADTELKILQALQADAVLRQQDLRGILLGELLFSQSQASPAVMNQVMQTIRRNQYTVSEKQLSEIYERKASPAVYWILLRDEAESSGIRVPATEVGGLLGRIIPQLFNGRTYPQVIQSLVNQHGVQEQDILETFGKLLAVLQYAQTICSTGNITIPQLTHMASQSGGSLDAEFVQLEALSFADKQNPLAEDAMNAQFEKYKESFAGEVTASNPFGFGYKLPSRIQFDYIALNLKDVEGIVRPPTHEEADSFYRQNRQRFFTEQVPSNPDDPNSPPVPKITSYAEVADTILEQLKQQKIRTKAEQILEEARTLADAKLEGVTPEGKEPSVEQLKAKAGDYAQVTKTLSEKHGITLHNGQTGWLNAIDVQTDARVGRMVVTGHGASPVRLGQVLFSVQALGEHASPMLFAPNARMHTTIGPISDSMGAMGADLSSQIMMVVRVVNARQASAPENLNVAFSTQALDLGNDTEQKSKVYSVKEKVVEDLQRLSAWDTTKAKAEELASLASQENWDAAVAKFNGLYGKQAAKDPNDPNAFKVDRLAGMQKISEAQMQVIAAQTGSNPASALILNETRTEKEFIDQLYSLVPDDADRAKTPQVVEFKASQSFYVLKDLSVQRLSQQQYEAMRGMILQQEEYVQTQNLAVVHFNPGNILKRMDFRPVKEAEPQAEEEGKAQQESKDAA